MHRTAETDPENMVNPLLMRVDDVLTIDGVDYKDVGRAGGGCTCLVCGKLFYDHPSFRGLLSNNGTPFLTELCGRVLVKL